MGTESR